MTHSQLLILLHEADTSPEEFGRLIGLSGMTLRRWSKYPKTRKISKLYLPAIREGCYQLISQNKLNSNSPLVLSILSEMPSNLFGAAIFNLDLADKSSSESNSRDQILESLTKVGLQNKMQSEVNDSEKKVLSFKKLGKVKFPRFSGHILPDRDVQKCWGIDGQEDKSTVHSRV